MNWVQSGGAGFPLHICIFWHAMSCIHVNWHISLMQPVQRRKGGKFIATLIFLLCLRQIPKATATQAIFGLWWWCDFLKIVTSPAHGENRICSHPRTGDTTAEKNHRKKSWEIQLSWIFYHKSTEFVTKCSHFHVPATRQFKKKLHHHHEQKIACVAAA